MAATEHDTGTRQEPGPHGPGLLRGTYADALELEALEDSKHLIKFAAEHKADLKQETVLALEQARDANDGGAWSSAAAAAFWAAFSALCNCVSPVTITSLYANVPTITRAKWRVRLFHAEPITSLSERTARRYTALLLALLLVSILLGYTVNSAKNTTDDVNAVLSGQLAHVEALQAQIRAFKKQFPLPSSVEAVATDHGAATGKMVSADALPFPTDGSTEMLAAVDGMQELGSNIDQAVDRAGEEVSALMRILSPFKEGSGLDKRRHIAALPRTINDLRDIDENFRVRQAYILRTLPWIDGIAQFINFAILPALLGTMGACAYVVRMISDQIKTSTFSRTSSIQHAVRVALGALTGVVLGFGGYFTSTRDGSALSAAAISFLAGYAVEPVFALFDKIAQSLKA